MLHTHSFLSLVKLSQCLRHPFIENSLLKEYVHCSMQIPGIEYEIKIAVSFKQEIQRRLKSMEIGF
jgi:hypothetical protein